jgi:hypothetical protein
MKAKPESQKIRSLRMTRDEKCQKIFGIDKIKLAINPIFLNSDIKFDKFNPKNRTMEKFLDSKNQLILMRNGTYISLYISAEFINPFIDIHFSIARAIFELVKQDVIVLPFQNFDNNITLAFIYFYLHAFILYVQELELFFNFKKYHIIINDDLIGLHRYYKDGGPTETYYTDDNHKGKKNSKGIIYDWGAKQKHERKPQNENPYATRLEFKLYRNNTEWLHLDNLKGSYFDIIKRYTPLLATIYTNYFAKNITLSGREYGQFNRIVKAAVKKNTPDGKKQRCVSTALKQSEPMPLASRKAQDVDTENAKLFASFEDFQNTQKGSEMNEKSIGTTPQKVIVIRKKPK